MPNEASALAMAPEPLPGTEDRSAVLPAPKVGVATGAPRTDVVLTPVEFFIRGPRRTPAEPALWAVRARLLQWATDTRGIEDSWYSRAGRLVFIDRKPAASPAPQILLPGTFVARCRILTARININGLSFDLAGPTEAPVDVDLLLWAEDGDWSSIFGQNDDSAPVNAQFAKVHLNRAVCLAGEIPFSAFTVHPDMPQGSAPWSSRLEKVGNNPILTHVADPAFSSSGLAFEAQAVLPWSPAGSSISVARYLAEVVLAPDGSPPPQVPPTPELVVVPDLERLDDPKYAPAKVDYLNAFADLATILQPEPLLGPHQSTRQRPRWVRLEPTASGILPGFAWFLDSDLLGQSAAARFQFDGGAWRLALSDQPAGVAGVSPQGVLSANAILEIEYGQAGGSLTAKIQPSAQPAQAAPGSSLEYTLTQHADGYHERIAITEAVTEYDPIAVAQALRQIANIATPDLEAAPPPSAGDRLAGDLPEATTADSLVVPQLLFGAMPLEDGWAQLPFLNVTDQILTDLLPEPPPVPTVPSLFTGATSFGTDRAELFNVSAGEPAWAVSVIGALTFSGTWTLQNRVLTSIDLKLAEPKLFLKGLFWLATAAATPEDALPVLDDFLGAIQDFTLQTPDPTDIYPSPFVFKFQKLTFDEAQSLITGGYSTASIAALDFSYAANDAVFDAIFRTPNIFAGFNVQLLPWGDGSGMPGSGSKLIIAGIDNNSLLHVRIFDANGERTTETDETKLASTAAGAISTFKQQLPGLLPPHVLTSAETAQVIKQVIAIVGQSLFDLDTLWTNLPLVWRRHGKVPAVQSLPLTQTKTPPNFPSASRQLFPFSLTVDPQTLRPGDWKFHSDGGASWPKLTSTAPSAIAGQNMDGLALLALGLPGLAWDPLLTTSPFVTIDPDDRILSAQYRHEVALLDEVNALATLPKEDKPPAPGDTPPAPPPALRREEYASFWTHQADLAFFATAEARDALAIANNQTVVRGLIEPFDWPVTAALVAAPYPGMIQFQDPNGQPPLVLRGATNDALRGLEGSFRHSATSGQIEQTIATSAEFTVVGEAMAAALGANGRIRDQRGLFRDASQIVTATATNWITTQVGLRDDTNAPAVILWTAMAPLRLSVGSKFTWNLWMRDLPAVDAGATSSFKRSTAGSSQRRDENDPAAPNRALNYLNGYEWRLGTPPPSPPPDGSPDQSPLPLGSLWFFPLSIESATFAPAQGMIGATMIGRLHLPFLNDTLTEPEDRSNAVLVTFSNGALSAVSIALPDFDGPPPPNPPAPFNDWPLADPVKEPHAPVFRWTDIGTEGTPPTSVVVTGRVTYARHGVSWSFPPQKIHFPLDGSAPTVDPIPMTPPSDAAVAIQSATLALNFAVDPNQPRGHTFSAQWRFTWGESEQLRLIATYDEPVLPPILPPHASPPPALKASLAVRQTLAVGLNLQDAELLPPNLDGGAVQIQWSGITAAASSAQVLPGFHLSEDQARASAGFATLAFGLADNPGDLPNVDLPSGGFLEALFRCEWGNPLQAPLPSQVQSGDPAQRIFGSSAGRVDAAYTATFVPPTPPPAQAPTHQWSPRLLLNGFVEVKDLASWPLGLVPDPTDNLVTLPAARPAAPTAAPALSHVRHTARILFHQHLVPIDTSFVPGPDKTAILLTIKSQNCWTLRAVVEHQFVHLKLDTSVPPALVPPAQGDSIFDTRITQVQEVRFCAPSAFRAMLDELIEQATADMKFPLAGLVPGSQSRNILVRLVPGTARGYLSRPMMNRFQAGAPKTVVDLADGDTMIVEASVPAMVRADAAPVGTASGLAYLPGGTTQAYLAALRDYQSLADDPREQPRSWTLLPLTFLGRLQPKDSDGIPPPAPQPAPAQTDQSPTLKVDPILWIAIGRSAGFATLDPVARTLANWKDRAAVSIRLAEFDMVRHRRLTRLDPSSLRESWFRLHLPPPNRSAPPAAPDGQALPIDTVLAAPPTDEVAAMGRPEVVARVLDPRRLALPPDASGQPPHPDPDDPTSIEWHPKGLFLFDLAGSIFADGSTGPSNDVVTQFGFVGVAAQLEQAGVIIGATASVRRPSATILRSPSSSATPGAVQPVSAAVSPYLGLDFQPSVVPAAQSTPVLVLTELVGFDRDRKNVVSIGSKLWDPQSVTGDLDPFLRAWGRDIQSRMAADSPAAVIRVRAIYANPPVVKGGPPAGVTVVYRFLAPEAIVPPPSPALRSPALRAHPASIRHVQGQYGGPVQPPDALAAFELAPPQIIGVQPIRRMSRPGKEPVTWPWGMSAYRFSVLQSAGGVGVAGPLLSLPDANSNTSFDGRLWWESLHHAVQYVVPEAKPEARRILPTLFRAQAMPGLLPAWPSSPLPEPEDIKTALEAEDDAPSGPPKPSTSTVLTGWQPVLPGGHIVLLAGARPGAPFAFRQSIQTQKLGDELHRRSVFSGSVPVMHRAPRPVLLAPNDTNRPEIALQPSAGAFKLDQTVSATLSPAESAFLASDPQGLDLVLSAPDPGASGKSITGGMIPAGAKDDSASTWDRVLRFQADGHGSQIQPWLNNASITLESTNPRTGVTSVFTFKPPTGLTIAAGQVELNPDKPDALGDWLSKTVHGDSAVVRVSVGVDGPGASDVKNFKQALAFPLRVAYDQGVNALPYRPAFFLFEDPQYNRRLASNAAQQSALASVMQGGNLVTQRVTLSADRHAYNATGQIHYLFFFDPADLNTSAKGDFQFTKIARDGSTTPLKLVKDVPGNSLPSDPADMDLFALRIGNDLTPGDTLVVVLTVHVSGTTLSKIAVLNLPIVAEPVNPVPEAGYALLRQNPDSSIECVRFAFSPEASRIELIDPNDLHGQNVRRRAVFLWRDTFRVHQDASYSYAIQKITTGGSTHFPDKFVSLGQPKQ
jgi:hypothetical protein